MIECRHPRHVVRGDRHVRRDRSQDVGLHLVEGDDLVGGIAAEIEPVRRARLRRRQVRQLDLVEVAIFHRPEDVAPGAVQRFDRAVSRAQPLAESERAPPASRKAWCRGSRIRCRSARRRDRGDASLPRRRASRCARTRCDSPCARSSSAGASRIFGRAPLRRPAACPASSRRASAAARRSVCRPRP